MKLEVLASKNPDGTWTVTITNFNITATGITRDEALDTAIMKAAQAPVLEYRKNSILYHVTKQRVLFVAVLAIALIGAASKLFT